MNVIQKSAVALLASLFLFSVASLPTVGQDDGLCGTGGNRTRNCNFDGYRPVPGFGRLANEWSGFVISGSPEFVRSDHSPQPDCQQIWSDGGLWEAGILQQVQVTPGQGLRAEIGWFTPFVENGANVGRIGLDPNGGTDPNSPSIVWSGWTKLNKSTHHQTKASATGGVVTVFVVAKFQQNTGTNLAWFDAVIVVPDSSAPPPPAPPATATNTPAPVPPTNTPRPTATRTPTRVPATNTPVPSATPTAAPTSTAPAPATPTPTLVVQAIAVAETETPTPRPTTQPTRRATVTPTPEPDLLRDNMDVIGLGLVSLSACALFGAIALGVFAYWYWQHR